VPVAELEAKDFELPTRNARDAGGKPSALERLARPLLKGGFTPMPRPKAGRCELCKACERACPTKAMGLTEKVAKVNGSLCIRCYCCHEVCPYAAIDLEFTGIGRVVHRLGLV
jgi:ferredoxin